MDNISVHTPIDVLKLVIRADLGYPYYAPLPSDSADPLADLVRKHWHRVAGEAAKFAESGEAIAVSVPVQGFHSSIVRVSDRVPLQAAWARDEEGESPRIAIAAANTTAPRVKPDAAAILALCVNATAGEWEVAGIQVATSQNPESPLVMARHALRDGIEYPLAAWRESCRFWSFHVPATLPPTVEFLDCEHLLAGVAMSPGGAVATAWAADASLLPKFPDKEPPHPLVACRDLARTAAAGWGSKEFAQSVWYWCRRPLVLGGDGKPTLPF